MWGATFFYVWLNCHQKISIHAPRVGSDVNHVPAVLALGISIHAPRVGSDSTVGGHAGSLGISIHAPRVGSDVYKVFNAVSHFDFNPRSPCGERLMAFWSWRYFREFQSTLPVWGATRTVPSVVPSLYDFNPRSPCGERPSPRGIRPTSWPFQSTLPVWGATWLSLRPFPGGRWISIHAPRVGSDPSGAGISMLRLDFNPRSPCGERRRTQSQCPGDRYFNPRSPCGERQLDIAGVEYGWGFQSTLPVWGATPGPQFRRSARRDFNPRSPCGERPGCPGQFPGLTDISIHAPRVGSDAGLPRGGPVERHFNPRSPCGERPLPIWGGPPPVIFQSTLPVWGAT